MDAYIGLIPGLPVLSFLIIVFFGRILSRQAVAIIAVGSVCLSAVLTIVRAFHFSPRIRAEPPLHPLYIPG